MAGRTAIGLDIGTSGVRAAELSYGSGGITLEKFGQVALPEGAVVDGAVIDRNQVVDALKNLWKGSGLKGKKVALGVANQHVVVRHVQLPWMSREELKSGLGLQVQEYLPMQVSDCLIDFHVTSEAVEEGQRTLKGLLVAASRELVMNNIEAVAAAGLRVASVDLSSFAVLRSLSSGFSQVGTEALLDIGARVSNLVIHSAGSPRFVRILMMGGQDVTDAIAERLGVPSAVAESIKRGQVEDLSDQELHLVRSAVDLMVEVFADEIRSSLDYYNASNAGFAVERVVVSGGGSLLAGMGERLQSVTRQSVVSGDALSRHHIGRTGLDDQQLAAVQPLAAVPVGLALGVIS